MLEFFFKVFEVQIELSLFGRGTEGEIASSHEGETGIVNLEDTMLLEIFFPVVVGERQLELALLGFVVADLVNLPVVLGAPEIRGFAFYFGHGLAESDTVILHIGDHGRPTRAIAQLHPSIEDGRADFAFRVRFRLAIIGEESLDVFAGESYFGQDLFCVSHFYCSFLQVR